MSDIDKQLEMIRKITEPVRKSQENLQKVLGPYVEIIEKIQRASAPLIKELEQVRVQYAPVILGVQESMRKAAEYAHNWQEARKEDVSLMAENGWYPNWFTFFYRPKQEFENIDELMQTHLTANWEDIKQKIIDFCPKRKHILNAAFQLHEEGNYVASIPLFISQADGICCESLKSFLFTNNTLPEKLDELIEGGRVEANLFTNIFLEPFKLENHHNAGIRKSGEKHKAIAPNRNGIMHGHRKHLDYGTKINSLKTFSLLAFIVYTTKDLLESK